jgi:hypothetical protein
MTFFDDFLFSDGIVPGTFTGSTLDKLWNVLVNFGEIAGII